jgi:hypothetical protein
MLDLKHLQKLPLLGQKEAEGRGGGCHTRFKVKPNAHSMCVHKSSLHIGRTENGYRITNVSIYSIYYTNNILQKTKLNTLDKIAAEDSITPQAIDRG